MDLEHGNAHVKDDYLRNLVSERVGIGGARTFHCNFGSTRVVDPDAAGGAIDYLARLGDFSPDGQDRQDLEHLSGDVDELREAAEAVAKKARWRSGNNAERVLLKITIELPALSTEVERKRVAEALVADWQSRGHVAVAAVHCAYKVQPHIHLGVTARPVSRAGDGWEVDRTQRVLVGKAAVQAERKRIAELINSEIPEGRFHPGRLRDTGIERKAKKRVPAKQWYVDDQRERDPEKVAEKATQKTQERADGKRRREADKAARQARKEARLAPVLTVADHAGWRRGQQQTKEFYEGQIQRQKERIQSLAMNELELRDQIDQAEAKAKAVEAEATELKAIKLASPKQIFTLWDMSDGKHPLCERDTRELTSDEVGEAIRLIQQEREKARQKLSADPPLAVASSAAPATLGTWDVRPSQDPRLTFEVTLTHQGVTRVMAQAATKEDAGAYVQAFKTAHLARGAALPAGAAALSLADTANRAGAAYSADVVAIRRSGLIDPKVDAVITQHAVKALVYPLKDGSLLWAQFDGRWTAKTFDQVMESQERVRPASSTTISNRSSSSKAGSEPG